MTTPTPMSRRRLSAVAVCASAAMLAAACGGAESADDATDTTTDVSNESSDFPVTVASGSAEDATEITIDAEPEAIISLSPTATENLWAIGAADQVVAVDNLSNFPEDAPTTELSGHQPNIEAILGYEPDLVVAAGDTNNLVSGLEQAGVPTLILPAAVDVDDAYAQMERLGVATGRVAEAAELVADTSAAVDAATAAVSDVSGLTYFHELDPGLYTVTSNTFIGQLYAEFGFTSIADEADIGDDYPQLSPEFVVQADPDLIVLTDTQHSDVTVDSVAERPGWADLDAVAGGHVVELDPDVASRWGPRIAEFAEMIGAQATALAPAAG